MLRILVVFTGGTIGSRIQDDGINVDETVSFKLLNYYLMNNRYDTIFDTISPLNILSENINPRHWGIIYEAIKSCDLSLYDGIIVTHGSDTLPYSSAALSFLMNDIKIPLVFTASNYPLDDPRSNGLRNFASCVDFIKQARLKGVYTIFENGRGECIVYLGTRMLEAIHITDQFPGFGDIYFGKVINGYFEYEENVSNPTIEDLKQNREAYFKHDVYFSSPIMVIKPYPGLNYHYYEFLKVKPKAIIHDLYHSGTDSVLEEEPEKSLAEFIKKCSTLDIKVYLVPFRKSEEKMYVTSKQLIDSGAIPLRNISLIAAIAKLTIAYSNFTKEEEVEKFIETELFFEYI